MDAIREIVINMIVHRDYRNANDSGIRRVIETCVAYGFPEPVYEAAQGGMAVTVFKEPFGYAQATLAESKNKAISGGVNGLLSYVHSHPRQRASEIAAAFRTIERGLKQLKEAKEIEFRGAPKTGGHFSTAKGTPSK